MIYRDTGDVAAAAEPEPPPKEEYGVDEGEGERERWGCISGVDTPRLGAVARAHTDFR
jgi:hypothetical protein